MKNLDTVLAPMSDELKASIRPVRTNRGVAMQLKYYLVLEMRYELEQALSDSGGYC